MAEIYLAGGCFWGTEHYFKNIDGVIATETGYANGSEDFMESLRRNQAPAPASGGSEAGGAPVKGPTYEQVYTDTTGFAETVRVTYNLEVLPLGELLEDYFCAIDPLSLNRQGEDHGTRYRTGIYYVDIADIPVIEQVMAAQEKLYARPLAVESGPLKSFFPAEERHQDYLDKNPEGYCHLSLKMFRYPRVVKELRSLLEGETDWTARMANTAALIKERFGFFWVGFYLVKTFAGTCALTREAGPDSEATAADALTYGPGSEATTAPATATGQGSELVLGPFQGPIACMRIKFGRGVCGTAWKERKTLVVPDVEAFPGHIACSSLSRSEIVVPIFNDGSADLLEGRTTKLAGSISGIKETATPPAGNSCPEYNTCPGGISGIKETAIPPAGNSCPEDKTCPGDNASGEVIGVLDIDSTELATFDQADALWLSRLVRVLTGRR